MKRNKTSEYPPAIPQAVPVVDVTPETAQQWLDTRFENERNVRKGRVDGFARDMAEGKWFFLGDPIRFEQTTQRLIDGQHRLLAVVASGTTQAFPVVGLPMQARDAIDTGSARSLGDVLQLGNHVHGRILAAIVRRLLIYRGGRQVTDGSSAYVPTTPEGVEFVNTYKEQVSRAAHVAYEFTQTRFPMPPSAIGAAYFLCAEKDREQADEFFGRVISGLDLKPGDPVAALRARALQARSASGRNMSADDAFRYTLQTWNHYRDGRQIARLISPKGGWANRPAPVPK